MAVAYEPQHPSGHCPDAIPCPQCGGTGIHNGEACTMCRTSDLDPIGIGWAKPCASGGARCEGCPLGEE